MNVPVVIILYMGGNLPDSLCVLMLNESGMLLVCSYTFVGMRSYLSAGNHGMRIFVYNFKRKYLQHVRDVIPGPAWAVSSVR